MALRLIPAVICLLLAAELDAQSPVSPPASAGSVTPGSAASSSPPKPVDPSIAAAGASPLRVTAGSGQLPNEHGQLWREYDITPYTARVTTTKRSEQALVDWILRETGYETWHSEPLAILSATPRTLRVYHTQQVQTAVRSIVERFVSSQAESQAFNLRVMTVESAAWRARVHRVMAPVQVQTPGVQAWLLPPEAAAKVLAEYLRRLADFRELNTPYQTVVNGQPLYLNAMQSRTYVRNVNLRPGLLLGFEPETAAVEAGYQLEFIPLLSADGRTIDAMIKCHIDQVEKMETVMVEVPTVAAPRQRVKMEVPHMAQFRFHERFRWPVDQVLLIGLGMVPNPAPGNGRLSGIPLIGSGDGRVDLLLMVESTRRAAAVPPTIAGPQPVVAAPYRR